jgi:hypothetical protein
MQRSGELGELASDSNLLLRQAGLHRCGLTMVKPTVRNGAASTPSERRS